MSYSFDDELEKANSEYGGGGSNFYKVEEGNENVIRVLTRGASYAQQYMGKGYRTLYGKEKGDPIRTPDDHDFQKNGRVQVPVDEDGKFSRPSITSVVYVLDRKDNKIKVAEFPYSVMKQIAELQKNPDYQFSDLPMPYDVRITYKPKAAPIEKYRVEVKPGGKDLTKDEETELDNRVGKNPPEYYAEQKKQRQREDDEKHGLRLSEEELADDAKKFNAEMTAKARTQVAENKEKTIEYPEDINPEDIPF